MAISNIDTHFKPLMTKVYPLIKKISHKEYRELKKWLGKQKRTEIIRMSRNFQRGYF